jgi:P-type Ca2+ transporter type 2C
MTVRALGTAGAEYRVTGEGYAPKGEILPASAAPLAGAEQDLAPLLEVLAGCNAAALAQHEDGTWSVVGDPTEGALLAAAWKGGVKPAEVERRPRLAEFPFDSDRKRMTVVREFAGAPIALCKGAPDVLLELCTSRLRGGADEPLTAERREEVLARIGEMAERGMRVLAAARREIGPGEPLRDGAEIERDLTFVGLAGMVDPPRPEARDAVERAQRAGIRVVMITGDHPRTAGAIARELGIARTQEEVLSGAGLDGIEDAELARRVRDVAVYARVTAAHKLRIVRAWKARGAVVAMTGDGVNDAPAIRGADVGIAMGRTGTEVTKEASDMVITDDDFASIVAAVEQGRGTFDNIRKTLQYLLAGNAGELLLMTVAVGSGLPLPLMPVQLLWINLVTDGLPALCLATDPIDRGVMDRPPRPRSESITNRPFVLGVVATGVLTAGVTLAVYAWSLARFPVETARAHAFTVLVFAELLRSFGARSRGRPVWRDPPIANLELLVVVLASVAIQLVLPHLGALGRMLEVPEMPMSHCLVLLAIGAIPLAALELAKVVPRRPTRNEASPGRAGARPGDAR